MLVCVQSSRHGAGVNAKMTLTVFDLAIGLQKNQPELKEKLNEWIETKIKNGKLNAIYEKYHGEPISQEILNR